MGIRPWAEYLAELDEFDNQTAREIMNMNEIEKTTFLKGAHPEVRAILEIKVAKLELEKRLLGSTFTQF